MLWCPEAAFFASAGVRRVLWRHGLCFCFARGTMAVNGQPFRPNAAANRFVLVIEGFKLAAGKKSTALVVETTVLDHWSEASGFGLKMNTRPARSSA